MMRRVIVRAPAKLNLALDILGLDARGYHRVDMVMQAVQVYEEVELARSTGYRLAMPGSRVPKDDNNTATKAAKLFFTELGLLAGADIIVRKNLPVRAGLAGGSADAAAVLVGLNALYDARLSIGELCELGVKIGADVPFALLGGTARATGFGEILQPIRPLQGCWFAIGMPKGRGNSTPAVYANYDKMYGTAQAHGAQPLHPDVERCVQAIACGNLPRLAEGMANALEPAGKTPATEPLKTLLRENGALAAMMTGSGAAVFGLFAEQEAAERAEKALRPHCTHSYAAAPETKGAQIQVVD